MLRDCFLVLSVLASLIVARPSLGADGSDRPAAPPADEALQRELLRLGDPDYYVREQALATIIASGEVAIEPLVVAAEDGSAEVAARATQALEQLLQSENREIADRADEALEQLAAHNDPRTAMRAEGILSRHQQLREERAVAAIRQLGGKVQYDLDGTSLNMPPAIFFPGPGRQPEFRREQEMPLRLNTILIGTDWTGGVEGLKHLRRLRHRAEFHLYVIRGSGVPYEDAVALSREIRELTILDRGPFLGIGGSQTPPCRVESLTPGAAADRASLKVGDEILSVNESQVGHFEDLVGLLKQHRPGETVMVRVNRFVPELRGERELDVPVTLDRWEPYFSKSADQEDPEEAPDIPGLRLR